MGNRIATFGRRGQRVQRSLNASRSDLFRTGSIGALRLLGQAGTEESSRRAAEWVKESVSATADPPAITEGDMVLEFSS